MKTKNTPYFNFDSTTLRYQKVNKFKQFVLDNPVIASIPLWIVLAGLITLLVSNDLKHKKSYRLLSMEYAATVESLNREIDADTLVIKIGRAILEGPSNAPLNDSIVYAYICECRAWYPDYIFAQYKIESASGTSDIAVNANNLFGMRPVTGKRKSFTTQRLGANYKGYGVYDNWHLSVLDKILWEHFRFGGVKPDEKTYQNSHMKYAEDEQYNENIKKMIEVFKDEHKDQTQQS